MSVFLSSTETGSSLLSQLSAICCALLTAQEFAPYAEAVGHNTALSARLVQLMLAGLPVAAVALQLPAARRTGQHSVWCWEQIRNFATVLDAEALRADLEARLAASGPGIGRTALQLLQPTCQLLIHLPLDSVAGSPAEQALAYHSCAQLAANTCLRVSRIIAARRLQGSWRWDEQAQHTCDLLQQLLPRLVPLLLWWEQLPAGSPCFSLLEIAPEAGMLVQNASVLLAVMAHPAGSDQQQQQQQQPQQQHPSGLFHSLSAALPFCEAASAALCSLAALAGLAERQAGQLADIASLIAADVVTDVAQIAAFFEAACSKHTISLPDQELRKLCTAVFALHTTACRTAYFSCTAWQPDRLQQPLLLALSSLMQAAAHLASHLPSEKQARAFKKQLVPMAVGHCAAVLALLGAPTGAQQLAAADLGLCSQVAESLALAMCVCPHAPALDSGLPALFCSVAEALLKVGLSAGRWLVVQNIL